MPTLVHRVAAIAAAALVAGAQPAQAQNIRPTTPASRWRAKAERNLQRALLDPFPLGKPTRPAGVTDVAFEIGPDGHATHAVVLHPSGQRGVDGLALAAVRRLSVPTPLPPELGAQRQIARIYFAPGDTELDEADRRAMVARTAAANGWAAKDGPGATSPSRSLTAER